MTDIPTDIMAQAISCADVVSFGGYEQNALLIAAFIKAERERSRWQDISTAPVGAKGITWMMLAYGPEGDQTTGMGMRFHDKFYAASSFYVGGHFESRQFKFQEHEVQPTHWMPLPAAPGAAQ